VKRPLLRVATRPTSAAVASRASTGQNAPFQVVDERGVAVPQGDGDHGCRHLCAALPGDRHAAWHLHPSVPAEELEPDSNVGFKTSTERQLHICKQAAELKGWAVSDRHLSGGRCLRLHRKRRSEFERLIADLEAGVIKSVVTWKLDRLSRNRRVWKRLLTLAEERGIIIASVTRAWTPPTRWAASSWSCWEG
jgi:Resolvase, N terminal domain